jgi:glc operon protein GlcG
MNRLTMIAATLGIAFLTATGAFAQMPPPDPNNPNEKVPDTMNPPEYGQSIDIATAKKVAAAAFAELAKRNWHGMCVAVVDTHGDLLYFERDDRCQYNSISVSQRKARMAARSRVPTLAYERRLASGLYNAYLPTLGPDYILSRGGNPLVVDGKVVGAIGVSGGAGSQDDTISQAGAAALK